MEETPVYEDGVLVGYNWSAPALFIVVQDDRGYSSVIQAQPARTIFEPCLNQFRIFDDA